MTQNLHDARGRTDPIEVMTWTGLFQSNLDRLFQTALLIVADPHRAERALSSTISGLDVLGSPKEGDIEAIERELIVNSVRITGHPSPVDIANARRMLQPSLWPVLELESTARISFVLSVLIGYATSACAQVLGVEENVVRMQLHWALVQLCSLTSTHPKS